MCIQHLIAYLWSTLTDQFQNKSHSACSFVVSARAYQPWYNILLSHQISTNRVYQPRNQPANRLIVSSRLKYCTIVYLGPLQPLRGIHQLKFTTGLMLLPNGMRSSFVHICPHFSKLLLPSVPLLVFSFSIDLTYLNWLQHKRKNKHHQYVLNSKTLKAQRVYCNSSLH